MSHLIHSLSEFLSDNRVEDLKSASSSNPILGTKGAHLCEMKRFFTYLYDLLYNNL